MMSWLQAQEWEASWWSICANTYGEEQKQLLYANRMGLEMFHDGKSPYNFDLHGLSVLDVGGGPCSLLLKCVNGGRLKVVDPLPFTNWVFARYALAGIEFGEVAGEEIGERDFGECWIYNVLQHTRDPRLVVENARRAAKLVRVFEWIDTPTNVGHLHTLTETDLNEWLGGEGKVEKLTGQNTCRGQCYYGIFPAA